jgi:hypothetical protein
MIWRGRLVTVMVIACGLILLPSCATLRIQAVRGAKPVWLSKVGDNASLDNLTLLNKGRLKDTNPQIVAIEAGTQVRIIDSTKKHCHGTDEFVKVLINSGDKRGLEGFICGDSITHNKVWAL